MKTKNKILIQNKIDGKLTPANEKDFERLLKRSSKARRFFKAQLAMHNAVLTDAGSQAEIDITQQVMSQIKNGVKSAPNKATKQFKLKRISSNLLKYAAVLILGIIIGSTSIYLAYNQNEMANLRQLAGTLVGTKQQKTIFSDSKTTIHIQNNFYTNRHKATIDIKTDDLIDCFISDRLQQLEPKNIVAQHNEFNFLETETEENALQYACKGTTTFEINTLNNNSIHLVFMRDNEIIMQVNLD